MQGVFFFIFVCLLGDVELCSQQFSKKAAVKEIPVPGKSPFPREPGTCLISHSEVFTGFGSAQRRNRPTTCLAAKATVNFNLR